MDLPEMFVSALVSMLVEKLAPGALSFILFGGIDDKIKEWQKILLTVVAVQADAEDRQLTEMLVQQWLNDVQKLAYDIDDFLEDLAFESRRRQMMSAPESSSKLRKLVSGLFTRVTPTAFRINFDMNRKIGEITNRLQELEKSKNNLRLKKYVGGKSTGGSRLPSTSLVDLALVYGRERDISTILTWLLEDRTGDQDSKLRIISIVGMGGIGKTTLAQSLYNNEEVKGCFRTRAWTCVLEDFDPLKISNIIYDDMCETSCTFDELNKVQVKLKEKLSNKKFLLVLDDVWNEDYDKWDLLCAPFRDGFPGSTIIVTTRSNDVAKTMGSKEVYDLKELGDADCLSLLAQHALERPNFDEHPEFKNIGEVIAKRCKGLPLAAKSLGGLLRTKGSTRQWVEVSTSKIWELRSNGIMPALRLSYHHLPPYLKPLFLYCSLFPKGYEFDKHDLILLWMAQGFLRETQEQMQMEELGCEYFSELLSRSIFQRSTGNKTRFVMHDLNNDLAQFLAGQTYFRVNDKLASVAFSEEARHASFIPHKYGDLRKFKASSAALYLRTLLPVQEKSLDNYFYDDDFPLNGKCYLSSMLLKEFPTLPYLRVLSFCGYYISELPKSIGDMNHLRYLDFSKTDITELPESVSGLYNLQTLLLHGCRRLVRLPAKIQKLINLRHLDIADTPSLKELPPGIGMLTYLRTLPKFIVDMSSGQNITELKGLHHLQGVVSINGMENVIKVQDAMEGNILGKGGLHELELKWSSCSSTSSSGTREEGLQFKVLDALKPQKGLESLEIEFYGGHIFPGWVGDRSFCDMVKIRLIGCKNCKYLPPLGQLTSLRELLIEGMGGVKVAGPEVFGTSSPHTSAFQSLIKLSFIDMDCWEEWSVDSANIDEYFKEAFPRLYELEIVRCRKLINVSLPKIPSVGSLKIHGCSQVVLRSIVGLSAVKNLEVGDISGLSKLDEGIIRYLGKVENLRVFECNELRYLWEEEIACQVLEKMKSLSVKGCEKLESLGDGDQVLPHNLESLELGDCDNLEKMPNWKNSLTSLRRLNISFCKKLPSTNDLQPKTEIHRAMTTAQSRSSSSGDKHGEYGFFNLESVFITGCPCLIWFPTGKKLPTTLKDLTVMYNKNVEELEKGMSLVELVYITKWSKLKSLPEGLSYLTRLDIHECEGIKSIPESSLPPTLISLFIYKCRNLEYLLCDNQMQSLKSLRELQITYCNNLKNYPSGGCWPPNLEELAIGDVKQPIAGWGLARLPTSLVKLSFYGDFPQLVSFTAVGSELPTTCSSLTRLEIICLENLESLNKGLENLSSLQHLRVSYCPNVRELPETLLPMLSSLEINDCPLLEERCKKEKRDYWPKITHIPCININDELVWGL